MRGMTGWIRSAAVLGMAVLGIGRAQAESVTLYRSALWSAYQTRTDSGRNLCGMGTSLPGNRTLYLKWIEGSDDLVVQVFKPGLAIPRAVVSNVALRFGEGPVRQWKSVPLDRRADFIELAVPPDDVRGFLREAAASRRLGVEFLDGGDRAWDVDMAGAAGAVEALQGCVAAGGR
jgi:hypothetical protein